MKINSQYIDGDYHRKNPDFHIEDSAWKSDQILKGIEKTKIHPKSITEVGCGAGEILVQLAKNMPDTTFHGFELSPQGYAMCKERKSTRVQFSNCNIFDDTSRSDLTLCIDVIEHIEDYYSFLRNLVTRSDYFIFHIPLDMNVQMVARSKPILMVRDTVGHLHYFSKDTAIAALEDTGYEVIDWFYTPNGVDRPKSIKAKILQIPRKILQIINLEISARFLGGYSLLVVAKPKSNF